MEDARRFIYDRCKEFSIERGGISSAYTEQDIDRCVTTTATNLSLPKEKVYAELVAAIKNMEDECVVSKQVQLKDYQLRVIRHMFTHRGIVVAFEVGKGKTLTAVGIAVCLSQHAKFFGRNITVYIITPTSLQENFKKEMRKFGVDPNKSNFKFYTIVGFVNARKKGETCKDALLIIDEAHNLRKDYRMEFAQFKITSEEQQESTRALDYIRCASDAWKVVLLTGTPVYNMTYDVVNLAAMVRGETVPLTSYEFGKISQNEDMFRKYFGCMFAFEKTAEADTDFPSRRDEYVYIPMNQEYYAKYMELEDRIKGRKRVTDSEEVKNAFMVKLRKAANNLTPCLKCDATMKIIDTGKKTIVYSQFISSGIKLIQTILEERKIPFRVITGSVPKKERQKIVQDINDPVGPNVLLITGAGGEGLDLQGIRNVVLIEKGWTVASEEQVIGRARRYKSHSHLPLSEQNVTVYHLLAVKPEEFLMYQRTGRPETPLKKNHVMSADLYLFKKSRAKEVDAELFRRRLEGVALGKIDCPITMIKEDIFLPQRGRLIDVPTSTLIDLSALSRQMYEIESQSWKEEMRKIMGGV
jgi:superfamily II DNA or RNA helicase